MPGRALACTARSLSCCTTLLGVGPWQRDVAGPGLQLGVLCEQRTPPYGRAVPYRTPVYTVRACCSCPITTCPRLPAVARSSALAANHVAPGLVHVCRCALHCDAYCALLLLVPCVPCVQMLIALQFQKACTAIAVYLHYNAHGCSFPVARWRSAPRGGSWPVLRGTTTGVWAASSLGAGGEGRTTCWAAGTASRRPRPGGAGGMGGGVPRAWITSMVQVYPVWAGLRLGGQKARCCGGHRRMVVRKHARMHSALPSKSNQCAAGAVHQSRQAGVGSDAASSASPLCLCLFEWPCTCKLPPQT